MSDSFVGRLESGAADALGKLGDLAHTIEGDLPGTTAKILGALAVAQDFLVQAHALLGRFFPNDTLPHPTANGAVAATAISPIVSAAAPAAGAPAT